MVDEGQEQGRLFVVVERGAPTRRMTTGHSTALLYPIPP